MDLYSIEKVVRESFQRNPNGSVVGDLAREGQAKAQLPAEFEAAAKSLAQRPKRVRGRSILLPITGAWL